MAVNGLLELLTKKMAYLTQRQGVIANNIANANTPKYQPKDLVNFSDALQQAGGSSTTGGLKMAVTNSAHLGGINGVTGPFKITTDKDAYETKPSGNAVVLEEQMTQLSQTYSDYSMVTGLYHKTTSLIKTALRGGG